MIIIIFLISIFVLDICSFNFDRGQCLASFPVWTYNSGKGLCEEAVYGGCNGNENRYSSEEECKINCQSSKGNI